MDVLKKGILAGAKVLVTGASGFIGRHLCQALCDKNVHLSVFLRQQAMLGCLKYESFAVDLNQRDRVLAAIHRVQPDYVIHLAAAKIRGVTLSDYRFAYEGNFLASMNLIDACMQIPTLKRFIFLGTCDEYGDVPSPFREDSRETPVNAYGASKLAVSQYLQVLSRSSAFPAVILRPSLVYGPGQGEEMFLPALIQSMMAGVRFPMTAGEQTRDYIYIDDVVDAIVCALFNDNDLNAQIINISSATPCMIKDVALMAAQLLGEHREKLLDFGAKAYRQGEAMRYCASHDKARMLLDWLPRISLETGLLRTIDSMR